VRCATGNGSDFVERPSSSQPAGLHVSNQPDEISTDAELLGLGFGVRDAPTLSLHAESCHGRARSIAIELAVHVHWIVAFISHGGHDSLAASIEQREKSEALVAISDPVSFDAPTLAPNGRGRIGPKTSIEHRANPKAAQLGEVGFGFWNAAAIEPRCDFVNLEIRADRRSENDDRPERQYSVSHHVKVLAMNSAR
jgi:hypothetical protein